MWVLDMRQGMRPYTALSAQNFERRFILYTRRGWEGKTDCLKLQEAFSLANVYSVLSQYSIESYSNRHNMLYSLVSFSKFLISLELMNEAVLNQLRRLRPKRVIPARKTVLREVEDIEKLRDAIERKSYETDYSRLLDKTILETFIHTGLRVSELCNLNLNHIDFERGVIEVWLGKGRKNRRVGLTKTLEEILLAYLPARNQRVAEETQAVFVNHRRGTRLKPSDVTHRLLSLSKFAGIEITAHGLRRTFATYHANQGKPLHVIQLALGHSDIRTTQEYLMTDENQVIQAMRGW
ncbi:MAG: tyrosine-type recombinase/integrase [Vampirovibrionales bacterium]|nr:tyrosine-type recombinase/integrase [Vampirovibrionales bacterium]